MFGALSNSPVSHSMPSQAEPRTLSLNAKDNVIVAVDAVAGGDRRQGRGGGGAHPARPQDGGHERSPRASRFSSSGRSSALRPRTSCRARMCTRTIAASRRSSATMRFAQDGKVRGHSAGRAAGHVPGLPPRQGQGRHAQLHRRGDERELLGDGGALHRRGGDALRPAQGLSECRWRHPAGALDRLRHRHRTARPSRC